MPQADRAAADLDHPDPLRERAVWIRRGNAHTERRAVRHAFRPPRPRIRPGDTARRAWLCRAVGTADRRVDRRRRHVRVGRPPRDMAGNVDAIAQPFRDLRREDPRGVYLRHPRARPARDERSRCGRAARRASAAGGSVRRPAAAARRVDQDHARVDLGRAAVPGDHLRRDVDVGRHAEQRCRCRRSGGRHVRAAADRLRRRAVALSIDTADYGLRGVARAAGAAGVLRADRLGNRGQRRLRGGVDLDRPPHLPSPEYRVIARARTAAGAAFLTLVLAGCGRSVITAGRLEPAIKTTFANLVHAQLARMGLHAIPASDLKVVASCYRVGGGSSGAGEWACTLVWSGPNGATLRDNYDVVVGANGCYTATLTSAEA